MADALVSAILQQLTEIIHREVEQGVKLLGNVEREVEQLTSLFEAIQAVLEDAERRQLNEVTVKNWLAKLKGVAYDMDDILDEWSTAIWQMESTEKSPAARRNKVSSFLPSCFHFNRVMFRYDIALKIKEVRSRMDAIAQEAAFCNFRHSKEHGHKHIIEPERLSTSFVDVSRVCGREQDKQIILRKLLHKVNQENEGLQVISVVGMGGVGKTTLAQLVYNDDEVKRQFKKRIWVCVSEFFDQIRIAKAILETLTGVSPNLNELQSLLHDISKFNWEMKFLLVLDDVWTQDGWEPLKLSLECGAPAGSRILVTSCKETVAKKMESTYTHHLRELAFDECWLLFSKVAFYGRGKDECENLTEMGKKLANKCKGLPFAAKTLGDLMQLKRTRDEWRNVLASELWELEEVERGLFPSLLLCYYDLPAAVRRCFLYCSIFPKDFEMEKDELIKLWMAHGYLGGTEMELVGKGYFENLVVHSFFQDIKETEEMIDFEMRSVTTFKIHDIVHDFVQSLTKNECFRLVVLGPEKPRIGSSYEKALHLNLILAEGLPFPMSIYKAKNLRSLSVKTRSTLICAELPDLFLHLTCLRSLDLSESSIAEIPSEVGKLIHLRYLNLSQNVVLRVLPEKLCNLFNLQCLNLTACRSLTKLPQGMGKLTNLRHLQMIGSCVSFMPIGLERLTSLRTLSYFIISIGEDETKTANLGELKNLNQLQGNLLIKNLGNVVDAGEALNADLKNKKNLGGLFLDFSREEIGPPLNYDDLIKALQAPSDLEYLRIGAYKGMSLPNWMVSLSKLKELEIVDCSCEFLPSLGRLSSLAKLTMEIRGMRRFDDGFLGIPKITSNRELKKDEGEMSSITAFPKLKEFTICYMKELKKWDGRERRIGENDASIIMPQLEYLCILDCPLLKALPDYILTAPLKDLIISKCPILEKCYQKGTDQYSRKISHIPNINIY
ncbi:putative disease resistance protein RGA3 [Manihot esculenta]|uniref:Disease resistance protein RGA3 n=7 Tax=Manihot esculenta TaxID=3983 RepID=A0A251LMV0_MANES|nr:putative disease resistance protein RGA3 [Manihot esculenta]XP_021605969.1 putative disease resistance protein RGA3 [Manihot esculenta]XP_021605970.1 putative disease resistance protein RGA3 [Manihot esculenta]XP_021605971.1 putative disease resistance protein RGA3 [Manihot esculenta]XP_021605972.1 putative disease resistance protein RGA3 [Manihot esculenta]XP_043811340.1 putative disease resistance protein RGA3 [Manihot esculenta]KAG8657557.1 hypothetical protein MANES_03G077400v8 [Maniho